MFVATCNQLKEYDRILISKGYSILELVNLASDCLLKHVLDYNSYLIVCGPGNNGADGLSLGIKLFDLDKKVVFCLVGDFSQASKANLELLEIIKTKKIACIYIDQVNIGSLVALAKESELVIDGIFGFGLNRDVEGIYKQTIDVINSLDTDVYAIDIPSGLDGDRGYPYSSAIIAKKTISLSALKQGYLNEESKKYTGEVVVESLAVEELRLGLYFGILVEPTQIAYYLKDRVYDGHKGTYGRVIHITGSKEYRGASLLAAKGSVNSGSGLVSVCSEESVLDILTNYLPEATSILRDENMFTKLDKYKACLIGSGLGLNVSSYNLFVRLLKNIKMPLVIDGDGLTILKDNLDLLKNYPYPVILTPHIGEFKRFCSFENQTQMYQKALEFAKEYKVVLVLKGPNTFISDGNEVYRNSTGNKAMAVAGMGDVLAGIIVGLLGQGYSAKQASILGVYIHGLAGDYLAGDNYIVRPSILADTLPKVMKDIVINK